MFFFLEKDSFEANSRNNANETSGRQTQSLFKETAPIRRPYRGIQIKDDTYAVLSVRTPDGRSIPLSSSSMIGGNDKALGGTGMVSEYSDFILQNVQDQRMEKQQIIETFGDTFVYFFGERPRIVSISGQLMNTEDFNWRAQFWHNYEKYFRGSRLVQLNARCYLAYDTIVVEGYPLSATAIDDAENPYQVSFQMTMLMTDYHEFSQIGSMKFPGSSFANLDTLNQELDESRSGFVSTTYQVRAFNLRGSTSNQIPRTNSALAALRAGVGAWNSAASWLGDQLHTVSSLLGGRSMRIPIGAASYLEALTEGEVAVGSGKVTTSATQGIVDPATGTVIPGRTLLIMGPSKFAPSWTSKVYEGQSRGMIYENVDEYPLRENPKASLQDLLTPSQYQAVMSRARVRQEMMTAFQESLIQYNILAAQGSVLGTIAEVVSAVRMGFGMLMTAANVIADPLGAVTGALGVTPQDVKRFGEGLKDGAFIPGVSMFVGGAARKTWESWLNQVGSAKIGDVFNGFEYKSNAKRLTTADAELPENTYQSTLGTAPEDTAYDMAYGDSDYTPLIESQATADADTLAAEGDLPPEVDRTEPNAGKTASTLGEVYGDTDSSSFGSQSEDPATLEEVYGGSGTIQKTRPSAEERAAMLQEAYNGDAPPSDTDTSGITAADADSAPIDPVV